MHFTVSTPHSLMCTIWSIAEDWRTIDHTKYTFSCNGGPVYSCEDMLRLGTYSALIGESAFYSSSSTSMHSPLLHIAAAFQYECLHILSMLSSLTLTLLPYLSVSSLFRMPTKGKGQHLQRGQKCCVSFNCHIFFQHNTLPISSSFELAELKICELMIYL